MRARRRLSRLWLRRVTTGRLLRSRRSSLTVLEAGRSSPGSGLDWRGPSVGCREQCRQPPSPWLSAVRSPRLGVGRGFAPRPQCSPGTRGGPACRPACWGGGSAPQRDASPSLAALIKYIRPVFVSRSDQDSRRRTVEEIRRRAQSKGKWPQVAQPCSHPSGLVLKD